MHILNLLVCLSVYCITAHSHVLQPSLSVTVVEDWEHEADRLPNRTEHPQLQERDGEGPDDAHGPIAEVMEAREEGKEEERNDGLYKAGGEEKDKKEENGEERRIVGRLTDEDKDHSHTVETEHTAGVGLLPNPMKGSHPTVPTDVSQPVSPETPLLSITPVSSQSEAAVSQKPHKLSLLGTPNKTLQSSAEPPNPMLLANTLTSHHDLTVLQEMVSVHMREPEPIPSATVMQVNSTSKAVLGTTHNPESAARYGSTTAQLEISSGKNKQKLSQFIQIPKNNQTINAMSKVQRTVTKLPKNSKRQLPLLNKIMSNQQRTKTSLNETEGKVTLEISKTKLQKNVKKIKDKKMIRSLKKDKKEKQKEKDRKDEVPTTPYFPYFKDDYCPSECACYGRVVQCSDKGVTKVPFGIPYNSRYILLMNNRIDSIQLDLLSEYLSMEFLVLSNNRLTDSSVEGSFEGVQYLKRLYLDRNLLQSIPTDLPASLEELRLDGNNISVMSEAAWSRCPGLLILSLNNNSLGNGSDSLSAGVLTPLGSLRTLSLNFNQLLVVPSQLPLSLRELYLRGNLIRSFHGDVFTGDSELLVLDLSANRLGNKGLGKDALRSANRLESLNLEGNLLKQVPRHLPSSLKTLNLEGNVIASVGKAAFKRLPNLEHLGLARNKIIRVALGAFRALPVLHQLNLSHNALRQVPRQLPSSLHFVSLTHNKIQSVPRDALCPGGANAPLSQLMKVQLEHNLIDMGRLDTRAFWCLRGFQVIHFD